MAIYGGIGALNPVIIVGDHIGTHTLRRPLSITYPLVWVILFTSSADLSAAGIIRRPPPAYKQATCSRSGTLNPHHEISANRTIHGACLTRMRATTGLARTPH
ncbi:hypothetical protein [Mycobacteroides abscessus]